MNRSTCKGHSTVSRVGKFDSLALTGEKDSVLTNDVSHPQSVNPDFTAVSLQLPAMRTITARSLAIATLTSASLNILNTTQRSSRRTVFLPLMVGLDDVNIVFRAERTGQLSHQHSKSIDTEAGIAC